MPKTKSAKKKLRQDKKRTQRNLAYKKAYKIAIKKAKKTQKEELIKEAYSKIDKAAKKGVIHKNKAARLKSRLVKSFKNSKKK